MMLLSGHALLQIGIPAIRALLLRHRGGFGSERFELGAGSGRYVCGEESQPTPFETCE